MISLWYDFPNDNIFSSSFFGRTKTLKMIEALILDMTSMLAQGTPPHISYDRRGTWENIMYVHPEICCMVHIYLLLTFPGHLQVVMKGNAMV